MKPARFNLLLFVLKLIAIFCMTVDHIYKAELVSVKNEFLDVSGRFAFPIFAYLVAQGMCLTKNISVYRNRLLAFAIVSAVPYSIFTYLSKGTWFSELNILFTLFSGVYLIESAERKNIAGVVIALVIGLISDYTLLGVGLIVLFYGMIKQINFSIVTQKSYYAMILSYPFVASVIFESQKEFYSQVGIIIALTAYILENSTLLNLNFEIEISEKVKEMLKFLFYFYYPIHLLIISLVALI